MRFPQVSDRVKEAPAQALRGVFAGIGQLLLFTDKLRNKTPASQQVPRARVPQPSETAPDATAPLADAAAPLADAAAPLRDAAPPPRDTAAPLLDAAAPLPDTAPPAGLAAPPEPEPEPEPRARIRRTGRRGPRGSREARDFEQDRQRHGCSPAKKPAQPGRRPARMRPRRPAWRAPPSPAPRRPPRPLRALRCRTMTSYPSRRCGRGCATSTLRRSGSWSEYEKAHAARADVLAHVRAPDRQAGGR